MSSLSVLSDGDDCLHLLFVPLCLFAVATLRIQGSDMIVRENERSAQVCVRLSHVIARPIEFELWTHSGTATSKYQQEYTYKINNIVLINVLVVPEVCLCVCVCTCVGVYLCVCMCGVSE